MRNVGVSVLSQWTPALAKKVITCFEKALPVRLKSNHIINTPTGFEAAYIIFKAFLGEKLKKRVSGTLIIPNYIIGIKNINI